MENNENLQDMFLSKLKKAHTQVTLFLTNGFQMRGVITGFDNFVIMVSSDGKQQMIYKHVLSTIIPQDPVVINGK